MEFFQVVVFVCNLAYVSTTMPDGDCFLLRDEMGMKHSGYSGLYKTQAACETRANEVKYNAYNIYTRQIQLLDIKTACPKIIPGQKI